MKLGLLGIQEQPTRSEIKDFHKTLVDQFYFFYGCSYVCYHQRFLIRLPSKCNHYVNCTLGELHEKVIWISGGEKLYYLNFRFGSDLLTPKCRDEICQ